jgi:hypothetical protein
MLGQRLAAADIAFALVLRTVFPVTRPPLKGGHCDTVTQPTCPDSPFHYVVTPLYAGYPEHTLFCNLAAAGLFLTPLLPATTVDLGWCR